MKGLRWLDHVPPWLAWGAMISSQVFEPGELLVMALPLLIALLVDARRVPLGAYARWIHAGAGLYAAVLYLLGTPVMTGITFLLFLLCGIRLALPRDLPQRRQILLMGFLLFLIASLVAFELASALWLLAWLWTAGAILMLHAWEQGARIHATRPPLGRVLPYAAWAGVLGALLFLLMPRLTLGIRPPWLPGIGWAQGVAGFSDRLDLGTEGPIAGNREVVLRVEPQGALAEDPEGARRMLRLLRGAALETYEGGTWLTSAQTSPPAVSRFAMSSQTEGAVLYLSPQPSVVVPLPYSTTPLTFPGLDPRSFMQAEGGGLRLRVAPRQMIPIPIRFGPSARPEVAEGTLTVRRRALLTQHEESTAFAHAWSLAFVPEGAPPAEVVKVLTAQLRGFRYTTDNPSGGADNPLRDFLLRTQAGHCEFFASALAHMLRHRGIPARVVNGYQLGTWMPEGGYFLVTQGEAHSWVEYFDEEAEVWRPVDPTPPAPASALAGEGLGARFQRWMDALSFGWDRYVVRFSDADQVAGFAWLQSWLAELTPRGLLARVLQPVGWAAVLLLLARLLWRVRHRVGWSSPGPPPHLPELRPLVRRLSRHAPPQEGETARSWLLRLATLRPERHESLLHLAQLADERAYGEGCAPALASEARTEAEAWHRWRPEELR